MGAEKLAPPGFDPRTVQTVASRYTVWAIPCSGHFKLDTKEYHCRFYVIKLIKYLYTKYTNDFTELGGSDDNHLDWHATFGRVP